MVDGMKRLPSFGPDRHDYVMAVQLGDHKSDEIAVQVRHVRRKDEAGIAPYGGQSRIEAGQRSASRSDVLNNPVFFEPFSHMPDKDDLIEEGLDDVHYMLDERFVTDCNENLVSSEPLRLTTDEHDPGHELHLDTFMNPLRQGQSHILKLLL